MTQRLGPRSLSDDAARLRTINAPPVFFRERLETATFAGGAFSTSLVSAKLARTDWDADIPLNARALILQAEVEESMDIDTTDPQADSAFFACGPTAASFNALRAAAIGGGLPLPYHATVPCTKGDIWYQRQASGAGTLKITLYCWGYWT